MTATVMQLGVPAARQPRPVLPVHSALDVAEAERFVSELGASLYGADLPVSTYLLGLAEGHLQNLIDLVRTLTVTEGRS